MILKKFCKKLFVLNSNIFKTTDLKRNFSNTNFFYKIFFSAKTFLQVKILQKNVFFLTVIYLFFLLSQTYAISSPQC